jgi:hypothetical protein
MEVAMNEEGDSAGVHGQFGPAYSRLRDLIDQAEAAAKLNDIDLVHKLHHQMLGRCVDLAHVSFFGLSVQRINEQSAKAKAANESNPD